MENFDFERLKKTINDGIRAEAEADVLKQESIKKDLSPQEKLARWKSLTTSQFDCLSQEDKAALILEYNNLIDQVKAEGGEPEEIVEDEEDFKRRIKKTIEPDLATIRKLAGIDDKSNNGE